VSRIRIAKAATLEMLDVFEDLNFDKLEVYRIKMLARIARGQVYGYLGEGDDDGNGNDHLDAVIDEASRKGLWPLVLEAKLAKLRIHVTRGEGDVDAERAALIGEANAKGYQRIANLAAASVVEPAQPAQPALPAPLGEQPLPSP
jgi:hypothetical protein